MAEKPILFNTEMVGAILDGRKTQTRQVVKPQYRVIENDNENRIPLAFWADKDKWIKPPYQVGDTIWVRETWCYGGDTSKILFELEPRATDILYKADSSIADKYIVKWRASIHMPREAARIFLKVKNVQVKRLNDITEIDISKEGIETFCSECLWRNKCKVNGYDAYTYLSEFSHLWDSAVKKKDLDKYSWEANPWVWVIEFERVGE